MSHIGDMTPDELRFHGYATIDWPAGAVFEDQARAKPESSVRRRALVPDRRTPWRYRATVVLLC